MNATRVELTRWMVRNFYPRTLACVIKFVGFEDFAFKVIQKTVLGDTDHKKILYAAFKRRHHKGRK